MTFRIFAAAVAVMMLAGCPSSAESSLLAASEAIERCEMREAHDHFESAWEADKKNPDAALGYALTELLFLYEADEVTTLLKNVGYTEKMDVQKLVFSEDGLLTRLRRRDSCQSISDFLKASSPTPVAESTTNNAFTSLIPANLKGEELREPLAKLSTRLNNLADAFEAAATQRKAGTYAEFSISACGTVAPKDTVVLLPPELLAASALARAGHAAIEVALAYDWDLSVRAQLEAKDENLSANVAELNAHFGHLKDAARVATAHEATKHAADTAIAALAAARDQEGSVGNALFEWSALPDARLDGLLRMANAVRSSLDRATVLPDVTPALTLDLNLMFTSPPDLSRLATPAFSIGTNVSGSGASYQYLDVNEDLLTPAVSGYTSPDLATYRGPGFQWSESAPWREVDSEPVIYPAKRFEGRYSCR